MKPFRWQSGWGLAVLLAIVPAAQAQQQFSPHVGYVYPAGGQQGKTFEVTVGGQFLDSVTKASISGTGVQATVVDHFKSITQGQFNKLRDELKELTDKKAAATKVERKGAKPEIDAAPKPVWTAEDEKKVEEIRKKLATFIRRPSSPAIAETVRVNITLAANAAIGERELRLITPNGVTNPVVFCVGQLPEYSKKPAKVVDEVANNNKGARFRKPADNTGPVGPVSITLPAIVNGQILPAGVDKYRFQATKGQHLVVAASARELIPYISDAVPGWFQATLGLYDSKGKEVTYAGSFRFHPDPILFYEIANDGEYTMEIKDSIYRGREDFVYRVTIGELPFVTSIFPLGGKVGAKSNVELKGWNLPVTKLAQQTKGKTAGVHPISVRKGEWTSNRVPFLVDTLPEMMEKEPNNLAKNAQRVKLPIIVNGRVDRPGDSDVFRFEGRAGEEIVAEVMARRLDSPLDSILTLKDSTGKQIAINDDFEDKGTGLQTHHADSVIRAKLPAAGTYYVYLGDAQHKGGPDYAYRLRISHPQPDFELRMVPSSISIRAGTTVPITVYAMRKDGFDGDIALRLKDAPKGFALNGGWVPGNQDKVRLTLTVPPVKMDEPIELHLEGRATVQGKEITRNGVPAEDMMQAFFYRHLVPSQEWMVRVTPGTKGRVAWRPASDKPVKLPAGGTAAPVKLLMPLGQFANSVRLSLNEAPEGIAIQGISVERDGISIVLRADGGKVKAGLKGNLIVDAYFERAITPGEKARPANQRRQGLGTLPAIPFEIVPKLEARR
jgi:hypothetical protein